MTDQAFRPPPPRPPDRYGDRPAPSRRRRVLAAVGGVFVLLAAAGWLWIAVVQSSPSVRHDLLGFHAVTDASVEIRFAVEREEQTTVACVLRARGADGEEVGRLQVRIPPEPDGRVELTSTVRTIRPAVTGEVLGCQPYEPPAASARASGGQLPRTGVANLLP